MRMKPVALLVGTLMVGTSAAALAQGTGQGPDGSRGARLAGPFYAGTETYPNANSGPEYDQWVPGPLSPAARRNTPFDNQYSNSASSDQGSRQGQGDQFSNNGSSGQGSRQGHDNQYSSNDSSGQDGESQPFGQSGSNPYSSDDLSGDQSGQNQFSGQSRFNQRSSLRAQLRRAGFHNVRILDAMFLVRAKTPSGEQVVMAINPPDQSASGMASRSDQQGGAASNRQFGQDQSMQGRQFGSNQSFGPDQNVGSGQQFGRGQQFGSNQQFGADQGQGQSGMDHYENTGSTSPQGSGPMWNPNVLQPDRVEAMLQQRGFSDISKLDREGMTYTGTADLFGEQVDLRVDARTGLVLQPFSLDRDQVATMLDQQGWNVLATRQQGTSVGVLAQRNGRTFELQVDPKNGQIMNVSRHGGSMNTGSLGGGSNRQTQ